ncbi:FxSxx-COOH system tetratricopeptide repeat protein [Dactylosporangium aurantiacum]|nr:FxSxx-COOH system tetratricopeptide repeat protein [Dactylosporangium aurantiacum]
MIMDRNGQVITFYSFKGGTGRTMALANVAWILAERGMRVLVADWDLESPGLHRFFNPFLDAAAVRQHAGVIDMIRDFENKGINAQQPRQLPDGWERHFANTQRFAFPIQYDFAEGGSIDFLSAGRQNQDYKPTVGSLDWDVFYDKLDGGKLFDALRADMKANYDYTLIDSRTGLSDVADICTIHLPDVLVDCFTFSEQGIDGAATVGQAVSGQYQNRKIRVLPVPMRVDPAEKEKAEAGRSHAMLRFAGLPSGLTEAERDRYWFDVEVPYLAWYAYEETLATFGDQRGAKTSLLTAYENITAAITDGKVTSMPKLDDALRMRWRERFQRKQVVRTAGVVLRHAPRDQVWHEWMERLLAAIGVTVLDPAQAERSARPPRSLIIASSSYVEAGLPLAEGALAVYVDETPPLPGIAADSSVFLSGLPAREAIAKITALLGRPALDAGANPDGVAGRYPGRGPDVTNAPVANVQFTGRDATLNALRVALRQSRPGAPALAVLYGLGGVGKTQVALEYVHRFGAAYDLVYWINAEPKVLIDTAFADLGERMGLPRQQNVELGIRAVQEALSRTTEYARWLIVFDNVDEFADIERFLPSGGHGHVIATTRNQTWGDSAEAIAVDVFTREESKAHLRRRVKTISDAEAGQIAELLGDLPIAVAVGGALLASSGTTPAQYREQIAAGETDATVNAVWDVSLNQLEESSPAAYRLLEICSVLAPDIALDLLNNNAMLDLLRRVDATLLRRPSAAKLIQQLNRLALLKLDNGARRIQVHRILQNVVRGRMSPERVEETQRDVLRVFVAVRPEDDVDNATTWDRYRMLWPHLAESRTGSLFEIALASDEPAVLELMVDRIRYVWIRGSVDQSHALAKRIEAAWRTRLQATTDPAARERLLVPLLRAQFNHANALRELGRVQEALALDTETLRQQTDLLGEAGADTLMTAGGLGADLRALGHYGQAMERDRTTFATWSQEYGEEYPRTLAAQHNLASSLRLAGHFDLAREQDELVIQRRERVLGRRTFFTLFSQGSLARDLRELGDYDRSIALLNEVVAGYTDIRGTESVWTLGARVNLAVSIRSAGRAGDAQPILDECYEALDRQFGAEHPETLACRLSRATNLLSVGRIDTARAETEAVRTEYTRLLGSTHPHTLVCDNNLSAIERARGDLDAALAAAEAACAGLTDALHDRHPFLLAARMNRAIILHEQDRAEEAVAIAGPVAALTAEVLGARHPDALRARANATLMEPADGTRAADPQVVADLAAALGEAHPAVKALQEGRFLHRVLDPHPI